MNKGFLISPFFLLGKTGKEKRILERQELTEKTTEGLFLI